MLYTVPVHQVLAFNSLLAIRAILFISAFQFDDYINYYTLFVKYDSQGQNFTALHASMNAERGAPSWRYTSLGRAIHFLDKELKIKGWNLTNIKHKSRHIMQHPDWNNCLHFTHWPLKLASFLCTWIFDFIAVFWWYNSSTYRVHL